MKKSIHKGRDGLKILVVDPNKESVKFITSIFQNEGLTVFSTNSMPKAMKIFEAENPSLIISEYVLGEYHTALDFFRKIRKHEGDDKRTPFILHTSLRNQTALYQAEIDGIDKFFLKPLSEDGVRKLISASKQLIKHYRQNNSI